jgi:hypothetical protein
MYSFEDRYKKLTHLQLLQIIERSEDYQPDAVITAQKELASRNLSAIELQDAKGELKALNEAEELRLEKKKPEKGPLVSLGPDILDSDGPTHNEDRLNRGFVIALLILLGPLSLFLLVNHIVYLISEFSFLPTDIKFGEIQQLFRLFTIPAALLLFWFRKKIGWIALFIIIWHITINLVGMVIILRKILLSEEESGLYMLVGPSSFQILVGIPICVFMTVVMLRKPFLNYFKISSRLAWIIFTLVFCFNMLLLSLNLL